MEPTRVVRMLWCCCGSVLIVNYGALQRTKLSLWTVENSTNEELLWIYDISMDRRGGAGANRYHYNFSSICVPLFYKKTIRYY